MKFCQRYDLIDRHSYVAQYLSLAILTIGVTTILGCDDLLAAFACGTAFAWDGFFNRQTEESVFSSVIDTLFNVAAFVFVGSWVPFRQFHLHVETGTDAMGAIQVWRLVVLAILVLLLRRLPIMMAMYRWIPDVKTWREAVFSGHFGPIGIGAIFISTLASEFLLRHSAGNPSTTADQQHQLELVSQMMQPIVAFMVVCSIAIHGLSIPGFSLGRRVHSVSRTWSRRDTTGSRVGAPDWTNQARLVTRPEDVVINRDLERGEEGRGRVALEKTSTRTFNIGDDGQKDDDSLKSVAITEERTIPAAQRDQDDWRNQFPPDGRHNQTREWIEGDQRVVERNKGGPGDDVRFSFAFFLFLV
jgi:NhaP-type Na+/H+ or K+/H+ antiporter